MTGIQKEFEEFRAWENQFNTIRVFEDQGFLKGLKIAAVSGKEEHHWSIYDILPLDFGGLLPEPGDYPLRYFRDIPVMANLANRDGRITPVKRTYELFFEQLDSQE